MHDKKQSRYAGDRVTRDEDGRKKSVPVFKPYGKKDYATAEFGKNPRYYEKLCDVGIHVAAIFYILEKTSVDTMEFSFSDSDKKKMADVLGKSEPSCRRSVKELYMADIIRCVGSAKYMLDPTMFYKGKESSKAERLERFLKAKKFNAKVRSKEPVDD